MPNVHDAGNQRRIGLPGHYSSFAEDGLLGMAGTARVVQELAFSLDGIGKGATAPTLTRLGNTFGWAFTINDDGYMSFEAPLNWDSTTDIEIGIHIYVNEDFDITGAYSRWQGLWSAIPEDGSEAVDGATHTGTLDSGNVAISTIPKSLQEIELGDIAAASLAAHDSVCIKLSRIAVAAVMEVTAEPVVVHAEYEWTANRIGEPT